MNRTVPPLLPRALLGRLRTGLHSRLPRLYPGALCTLPSRDAVAITVDDGPGEATPVILAALREHALVATFFVSGEAVRRHPGLLRTIAREGHTIATHGDAHRDLSLRTRREVREDIRRGIEAITEAAGSRPTLFRPPYGRLNPLHRDLPSAFGCRLVLWSSMPGDFDHTQSVGELLRGIDAVVGGDILVLHDRTDTAERAIACIRHLAGRLRRDGLRAVTL